MCGTNETGGSRSPWAKRPARSHSHACTLARLTQLCTGVTADARTRGPRPPRSPLFGLHSARQGRLSPSLRDDLRSPLTRSVPPDDGLGRGGRGSAVAGTQKAAVPRAMPPRLRPPPKPQSLGSTDAGPDLRRAAVPVACQMERPIMVLHGQQRSSQRGPDAGSVDTQPSVDTEYAFARQGYGASETPGLDHYSLLVSGRQLHSGQA